MNILNNPELIKEIGIIDFIFVVATVFSFFFNPVSAIITIGLMIIVDFILVYESRKRYSQIQSISDSIDRILYGQQEIYISDCKEGELSILSNEISKMTMRLKEQSDLLLKDKIKLTDAIADIFHQLRTPLTSMNINLALLEEEELPLDQRLEYTRKIYKQLERIQWLVESLLKISKIDAKTVEFKKEKIEVKDLINKSLESLLIPLDIRNIKVIKEIEDESLEADLNWTVEALSNVLKNSYEHTPEGGMIKIMAQETPLFTEIVISDNGEGFSQEDIPHLFERFFNGKNAGKDSIGIGLSLSRMIITAQNGTISACNGVEGGAVFIVKFYKSIV